jgi:hypothetical protein
MLCTCTRGQRPSDELSLYSYTPASRHPLILPRIPSGELPALPPPRHSSSPKRKTPEGAERAVLLAEQSYPEQLSGLNGSANCNLGFDSGIESGKHTHYVCRTLYSILRIFCTEYK